MDSVPSVSSQKEEPSDKPSPQPSKSKKAEDRKKAVGQNSSSKRQLRSSGQILDESPSIPPTPVTTSKSKPSITESKDPSLPPSPTLEQAPPKATEEAIPSETNIEPKSDCPISATSIPALTLSPTSEQIPPQATEEATPSETSIEPKSDCSISATFIPALALSPTSELEPPQAIEEVIPSETSVESNLGEHLSEQTDGQSKEHTSPVISKPKLRSAKTEPEESEGEKVESVQKENPVKDEPRVMSLRSKRSLQLDPEPSKTSAKSKPNEVQVESSSSADTTGPVNKKPARMPLRSEANKVDQAPPTEEKRPLRSQRSSSAARKLSEEPSLIRMTKTLAEPTPQRSSKSGVSSKSEPIRSPSVKFLNALNGAKNQQLISNLNLKFDKMHKGWMQLDREGQPAPKHKNKADRQAAIWKSKRRVRKPKLLDNQKYSPVQMLFMKGFDLDTICRWFLQTTETKSLVIVKKVNTRLPSETQLCFHSSGASGSALGVYPSLQAERLKKHLKKFAIASPVKSNPKTQKLIAKALEQELISVVKGKEKKEETSAVVRKIALSSKNEPQKAKGGKAQNPASARILRKYSNIREKQANARLKEKAKVNANLKSLTKEASKNSNLKALKSAPVKKQLDVEPKSDKKKVVVEKANVEKSIKPAKKDKAVKSVKAACEKLEVKDEVKKELPKRTSKRLGPPPPEQTVGTTPKSKTEKNVEEKKPLETSRPPKTKAVKVQKEPPVESETKRSDNPETNNDGKAPNSPDQVQTRSQRRVDSASPVPASPKSVTKKSGKGNRTPPAEKPALTRSSTLKLSGKRSQTAVLPRSASKRAQEALETPAKRTRSK
uniref:Uncharacterized protein n=1 Tax=Knipowitschia caucasica TaxID=637954 RepID=A0AAV2JK01_KNICA